MKTFIAVAVLATVLVSATPAHAITTAQRVAMLKYQKCMSNLLVADKTLCHL